MKHAIGIALVGLVLVAGCAGGGGSSAPSSAALAPAAPTGASPVTATSSTTGTGTITFVIANPAAKGSSSARKAQFISPSANTVGVTVNAGTAVYYDVSPYSSGCTYTTASRTCSLTIGAPAGALTVALAFYDGTQTAPGTLLGSGSGSTTVTLGTPWTLTIPIQPVVKTATGAVVTFASGNSFVSGTPETASLAVTVEDPDGNIIPASPAPTFAAPLTIASSDTHVTVTPASWTGLGQPIAISYDGSAAVASSVTISISNASGLLIQTTISVTGSVSVNEYPVPTASSKPESIVAGPDGALWFTEAVGNKVGRITTAGTVTNEYAITSTANPGLGGIAVGSDGALWFTEVNPSANRIGRITTAGVITEFTGLSAAGLPYSIAAGADGNLWFTEFDNNIIGRITTAGVVTEFAVTTPSSHPSSIAPGPDGALWFTENTANKIGRISTAGAITEYPIPTASSAPTAITQNATDGTLWFTESAGTANKLGRITTAGVITEYPIAASNTQPAGIAAASDGSVWFTEPNINGIGHMSATGASLGSFAITTAASQPFSITLGPDAAFWFTENSFTADKIGRIH